MMRSRSCCMPLTCCDRCRVGIFKAAGAPAGLSWHRHTVVDLALPDALLLHVAEDVVRGVIVLGGVPAAFRVFESTDVVLRVQDVLDLRACAQAAHID